MQDAVDSDADSDNDTLQNLLSKERVIAKYETDEDEQNLVQVHHDHMQDIKLLKMPKPRKFVG